MNKCGVVLCAMVATVVGACAAPEETDVAWSSKQDSMAQRNPNLAPMLGEGVGSDGQNLLETRDNAIALLMQAVQSELPILRANAIEGLRSEPTYLSQVAQVGLADTNRGVRFVTAMTIGRAGLKDHTAALQALLSDRSDSVRAAAMFALRVTGQQVDLSPLSAMLESRDPEVQANAAMIVGELGNESALRMLRSALGKHSRLVSSARARMVDLQIAEAMVMLGDETQIEPIHAALFARDEEAEITGLACQICGRVGDASSVPLLLRLAMVEGRSQRPPDIRMAALAALARIEPGRATADIPLQYTQSGDYRQRAQAAYTLGLVGDPSTLPVLAMLMSDPNPVVQVAAAAAVVRMASNGGPLG